jgi:hypothetical protein
MTQLAHSRFLRGQAMMEFLVFAGVAISLFLGILYLGKFHDIQAHTIQAVATRHGKDCAR